MGISEIHNVIQSLDFSGRCPSCLQFKSASLFVQSHRMLCWLRFTLLALPLLGRLFLINVNFRRNMSPLVALLAPLVVLLVQVLSLSDIVLPNCMTS